MRRVLELKPDFGAVDARRAEAGRYWVPFAVEIAAQAVPVFSVFVARSVEHGDPFRTLVWIAELPIEAPLAFLVDECFDTLGQTGVFNARVLNRENEVLIFEPRESNPAAAPLNAATPLWEAKFFRLDYRAEGEIVSFSCRALETKGQFELAVLLEQSRSFSDDLLMWALSIHQLHHLRRTVDFTGLKSFLNSPWGIAEMAAIH